MESITSKIGLPFRQTNACFHLSNRPNPMIQSSPNNPLPKQGFALVISLSLMAFVILLLVSISSLIKVQVQRSVTDQSVTEARMNAMLGLQVALGQLQKAAGADQRVSAQSFISDTSTTDVQATTLSQPYWTQIWNTTATSGDPAWPITLVSGTAPDPATGPDLSNAINIIDTATLGTVTADDKRIVTVEKESIEANRGINGKYAWWVGDEGVKASIQSYIPEANEPWLHPNRFNPQVTFPELDVLYEKDPEENRSPASERLVSRQQTMALSVAAGTTLGSNYHDYTILTENLLTDVVNGGFKKNLTAALNAEGTSDETEFNKLLNDPLNSGGEQIFPPQLTGVATTAPAEPDPGGPKWRQLASFFQNRVDLDVDAIATVRPQTDDETGVYPVLQMAQIYFYAALTETGTPNEAHVRYIIAPIVTLWNPYNTRLELNGGRVDFMQNLNGNSTLIHARWQEAGVDQEAQITANWYDTLDIPMYLPDVVFEPGETKMFSVNEHQLYENETSTLSEGIHFGFGFYRDWTGVTVPIEGTDSSGNPVPTELAITLDRQPQNAIWSLWANNVPGFSPFPTSYPSGNKLQEIGCQYTIFMGKPTSASGSTWAKDGNGDFIHNWSEHYTPSIINDTTTPAVSFFPAYGYKTAMHLPNSSVIPSHSVSAISNTILQQFPWLVFSNPRATQLFGDEQWNYPVTGNFGIQNITAPTVFLKSLTDAQTAYLTAHDSTGSKAYTGYSDTQGVDELVLYDLPRNDVPIYSLGAFSQAPLAEPVTEEWKPLRRATESGTTIIATRSYSWRPSYLIGSSWADPRIPSTATHNQYLPDSAHNGSKVNYDLPTLLNRNLWDRYFLTGMEVDNGEYGYIHPVTSSTNDPNLLTYDQAAPLLKLSGGFNINSTSVEAWEALIAATWNTQIPDAASSTDRAPYIRNWYPRGGDAGTGGGGVMNVNANVGYRQLTQNEITALAQAIVQQVKRRGPFLSLADFVNRSVNSSDLQLRLTGALQAAIDSTTLNQNLSTPNVSDSDLDSVITDQLQTPEAYNNALVAGIPGYFSQMDLLARLGQILTPRSDTFVIRAYGETIDPISNRISASAWVEATVQRTTQRISGNIQDTGTGSINDFGRRFEIVSLRWLNEKQ